MHPGPDWSNFYLQTSGVAMGSEISPGFASLYLERFESEVIFKRTNPYMQRVSHRKRYLDDIFYLDWFTETDFIKFHEYMYEYIFAERTSEVSADLWASIKWTFLRHLVSGEGDFSKTKLYWKKAQIETPFNLQTFSILHILKITFLYHNSTEYQIMTSKNSQLYKWITQAGGYHTNWMS